jgi:23S rRNA (uracil1939-C5)-methyltransferase
VSRPLPNDAPAESGCVTDLNHDGAGVLHVGKTVFLPGSLPGEAVTFRRRRRHRQHDDAELVAVERASPDRVPPQCAHFGVCGGCALQHLASQAQLAAKRAQVAATLARVGRVEPSRWLPDISGPSWGCRRARLGVKYVRKRGAVLVGFRERNAPFVAALDSCHILAPPVGALVAPLSRLLTGLEAREQIAQIEVAVGEHSTVLVLRNLAALSPADRNALGAFEAEHGVRIYLQPGRLDSIAPLSGEASPLRYSLTEFGLQLEFGPADFVQINGEVNARLVSTACALLGAASGDRVLDLFCGLGNFTLAIARGGAEVVGIEGESALIARARANANLNGIAGASFHVANLAEPPSSSDAWATGPFSHALIDPPRLGAEALLPWLGASMVGRIVYVSCHPGTLARDLGVLVHQHGFALQAVGVVDMFPHTTHVESLALLERPRGR